MATLLPMESSVTWVAAQTGIQSAWLGAWSGLVSPMNRRLGRRLALMLAETSVDSLVVLGMGRSGIDES